MSLTSSPPASGVKPTKDIYRFAGIAVALRSMFPNASGFELQVDIAKRRDVKLHVVLAVVCKAMKDVP